MKSVIRKEIAVKAILTSHMIRLVALAAAAVAIAGVMLPPGRWGT
jgi:hypothetical protein